MMFKEGFQTVFRDIKHSLKNNFLYILILDLALVMALKLFPEIYRRILESDPIYQYTLNNNIASINPSQIPENLIGGAYMLITKWIFLTIALVIVLFFVYTYTRTAIWNYVVKKKLSLEHSMLFVRGNLLWLLIGVVPTILIMLAVAIAATFTEVSVPVLGLALKVLLWLIFLFFVNLSFVFSYEMVRHRKVMPALSSAINIGVRKVHHFVLPYGVAFLIIWAIYYAGGGLMMLLLKATDNVSAYWHTFYTIWLILLGLLLIAWLRFFVDAVIVRIAKKKV